MQGEPGAKARMRLEARRISSQHRQLDELFGLVVGALAEGRLRRAEARFRHFQDAMEAHFSLEDEVYFPALHGLRRGLTPALEELSQEHARFRSELVRIADTFSRQDPDDCACQLDDLTKRIADHETREESLIAPFRRRFPERS